MPTFKLRSHQVCIKEKKNVLCFSFLGNSNFSIQNFLFYKKNFWMADKMEKIASIPTEQFSTKFNKYKLISIRFSVSFCCCNDFRIAKNHDSVTTVRFCHDLLQLQHKNVNFLLLSWQKIFFKKIISPTVLEIWLYQLRSH